MNKLNIDLGIIQASLNGEGAMAFYIVTVLFIIAMTFIIGAVVSDKF